MKFTNRGGNVITAENMKAEDIDLNITRYNRLVDILEDRREKMVAGKDLDPFVMVIDEAAQIFTGVGADQHRANQGSEERVCEPLYDTLWLG